MKVLIDGIEVKVENDVKIIYELPAPDVRDADTQVHLTFTHEGMIGDLFQSDGEESVGTFSMMDVDMDESLPFH